MDPKIEQQLLKWYEELSDHESDKDIDSDSEIEDAPSEHSVHATDTEQSADDEEVALLPRNNQMQISPQWVGKDGTAWLNHKPNISSTKTRAQNIVSKLPGVKAAGKNAPEIVDCWKLFFPDSLIAEIVTYTNQKLDTIRQCYKRPRDCLSTDFEEISAFIGLLYMAGIKKAQHLNTDELWSKDGTAPDFFSAVMSKKRFHLLVQAIRFDDMDTRSERSKIDNLAAIRAVYEQFVQRCSLYYTPGEYVTIDEMLEAFRGRCRFRQYIANKPAKYGIKIYALVDSRTFYVHNMEIYAGKQPDGAYQVPNDAASVVKRLIKTIDKSGRNVTADNYFTSIQLANDLLTDHKLTLVGTLRKNKREIPPRLLQVKDRPVQSSMFAFGVFPNRCMLASFVPKKNKNVLMISTFHDDDSIDEESAENKPQVITFYNLTKGGVDVVDRMKAEYSVTRVSNRWPLTLFCTFLNIATVNSQIIYKSNTGVISTRRKFINLLSKQLTRPHLVRRASITTLPFSLRQRIKSIANIEPNNNPKPSTSRNSESKPRCGFCATRKNRFTQHKCHRCQTPICKEHTTSTIYTCYQCVEREWNDCDD